MIQNGGEMRNGCHIPVLLSQIMSLEELSIRILYASDIEPEVWNSIDQQVDRLYFLNLQRLNISLGRPSAKEGYVKEMLPLCATRGILRFC
jgi:hypothetical protein